MHISNLNRFSSWMIIGAIALFLIGSAPSFSAEKCDQVCLRHYSQIYIEALAKNNPKSLPIAGNLKFTENGKELKLGEGLWQSAKSIGAYRFFVEDPNSSQASFIGIVDQSDGPAILWLRLKINNKMISEIETIVARRGSHAIFTPEALKTPYPSFAQKISSGKLEARDRLIAITNTYFDGIQKHDSKIILANPSCVRIENGMQTTQRNIIGSQPENCATSADLLTYIKEVNNRRFPIVDSEHGVVLAVLTFHIPADSPPPPSQAKVADPQLMAALRKARTLLLAEVFKIEDGKIQHVEAVMHNLPYGSSTGW
jgi:hypothetical protein